MLVCRRFLYYVKRKAPAPHCGGRTATERRVRGMRAGIKSILLILACAVLFGAGFRPRPLPAAAYAATGYSFAGALRAWKESLGPPLPEAVLLDVPVVYQWPEMPNGCEATALTMLLQYYGFAADKLSVAYDYIPPLGLHLHLVFHLRAGPCLRLRRRSGAVRLLLPGPCRGRRSKPLSCGTGQHAARGGYQRRGRLRAPKEHRSGTAGGGLGDHRL